MTAPAGRPGRLGARPSAAAVASATGVDVAGHRLGQLRPAVALGHRRRGDRASAASQPLEDLRGTPDADGRVMRSTIRAVADEIASAAELALGKIGRPAGRARPWRVRRPAARADRDALIPRSSTCSADRPRGRRAAADVRRPDGHALGDEDRPPDPLVHWPGRPGGDRADAGPDRPHRRRRRLRLDLGHGPLLPDPRRRPGRRTRCSRAGRRSASWPPTRRGRASG